MEKSKKRKTKVKEPVRHRPVPKKSNKWQGSSIAISSIKNAEPTREVGDLKDLKESIKGVGIIQPVILDTDDNLICGARRLLACKELHRKTIPYVHTSGLVSDDLKILKVRMDENIVRKNLAPAEESAVIKQYHDLKVKLEGKPKTKGQRTDIKPKLQDNPGWKQEDTANDLKVSRSKVTKAINEAKAIEKKPELAKEKTHKKIQEKSKPKAPVPEVIETEFEEVETEEVALSGNNEKVAQLIAVIDQLTEEVRIVKLRKDKYRVAHDGDILFRKLKDLHGLIGELVNT